jgi:CRISPR-associated protein Csd2
MSDKDPTQEQNPTRQLHHNLITLPDGKSADDVVCERHELVLLFDVTKANPNGDPDTGNMPRLQPDTLKGLVTDVCLKRKVRNFFSLYLPNPNLRNGSPSPGYEIFIRENAILQQVMESPEIKDLAKNIFITEFQLSEEQWAGQPARTTNRARGSRRRGAAAVPAAPSAQEGVPQSTASAGTEPAPSPQPSRDVEDARRRAYRDALCRTFFDLRAFGGVTSTEGPLRGSFYGQIRGPLQFTFSESLDRILQLDATITRCAVASEKEKQGAQSDDAEETGNRTMGRKHVVNYGLYRAHIYFSPAFAAKTGFTYYDLDNFLFALIHMFRDDSAAGRAGMRVVGLVDFQHTTALGNEHAHKLFAMVRVERTEESQKHEFPESLRDYWGTAPKGSLPETPLVTAKQLIWEIPPSPKPQQP